MSELTEDVRRQCRMQISADDWLFAVAMLQVQKHCTVLLLFLNFSWPSKQISESPIEYFDLVSNFWNGLKLLSADMT